MLTEASRFTCDKNGESTSLDRRLHLSLLKVTTTVITPGLLGSPGLRRTMDS